MKASIFDYLLNKLVVENTLKILEKLLIRLWKMIKIPFLAVNRIIKLYDENLKGIVLIERQNKPYEIAISCRFVDICETVEIGPLHEIILRDLKTSKLLLHR